MGPAIWISYLPMLNTAIRIIRIIFILPAQRSCWGVYWFHSVRPSTHIKDGKFYTKTYDKREAFNFEIVNYPDLSGNIPERPAYGTYISQVICYAKIFNQTNSVAYRYRKSISIVLPIDIENPYRLSNCLYRYISIYIGFLATNF